MDAESQLTKRTAELERVRGTHGKTVYYEEGLGPDCDYGVAMNVVYEELPGRRAITVTALAGEYRLAPRVEYRRAGSCGTIDPLALVESWTITFTKMEEGHGRDADNQITPGTV